jgi:hypothetical protein
MKTEADHLREFEDAIRLAVASATAIGFYRNNQGGWMKIAALLDEVAKKARMLAVRRVN